ncbi:MAG TPA: Flp pilus assembly protein CpaB [Nitrospirota bacterium]
MATSRRTALIVAAAALLLSSLSAVMVYKFVIQKNREAALARMDVSKVVVAAADIPYGTKVKGEQIVLADWPKDRMPKGAISQAYKAEGRFAIAATPAGVPVLESSLAPENACTGVLSYLVPEGKRAITVAVNEVVGVAGFVLPNSMVDVVATVNSPYDKENRIRISKIVLQNVKVLAVGQILEQKEGKPVSVPTVTLDVTPEDAEKLALASENKVQLILRHMNDGGDIKTPGATVVSLLEGGRLPLPPAKGTLVRKVVSKVVAPQAPQGLPIEVIKGSMRTTEKF